MSPSKIAGISQRSPGMPDNGGERVAFDVKDDPNPYARGWLVLTALIAVSVVGAFVVIFALNWR
jgi:hypothetical protein